MPPQYPQTGIRVADASLARWLRESPQYRPGPGTAWYAPVALFDSDEVTLSSGAVSSWTDLSGNGYHLTQSTADRRPGWTANSVNGHAAVNFTRASVHWLQCTFAQNEPCDVIMVARVKIGDGVAQYVLDSKTAEKALYYLDASDNSNMYTSGAPGKAITTTGSLTYVYHVLTMRWKAGTGDLRSDASSVASGSLNDNAFDGLTIGAGSAGATLPTTMDVAWLGVFPATVSTAQLTNIEAYLKARYNTP